MYEIKYINPLSFGKTLAIISGSIFVVSFVLFVTFLMGIGEIDLNDLFYDEFLQIFVVGAVVSFVGTFLGGFLGSFLYNKFSESFGGIELDIEFHGEQQAQHENTQNQNTQNNT